MLKTLHLLDEDVAQALTDVLPTFVERIKRGFANVEIQEALYPQQAIGSTETELGNIYFRHHQNDVVLSNLQITNRLRARLKSVDANLHTNILSVAVNVGDVELKGVYDVNNLQPVRLLPIQQQGVLNVVLENVRATGCVGVRLDGDTFCTDAVDLHMTTAGVRVQVIYPGLLQKVLACESTHSEPLEESICAPFVDDVWRAVSLQIRRQMDASLRDLSVIAMLRQEVELIQKYHFRTVQLTDRLNRLIDDILNAARQNLQVKSTSLPVPGFTADFSAHQAYNACNVFTKWGTFTAENGSVQSMVSLRRSSDFFCTIPDEDNRVQMFGSVSFDELTFDYTEYTASFDNTTVSGHINSTATSLKSSNSRRNHFLLTIRLKETEDHLMVEGCEIRLQQMDGIKVEATGLGGSLEWLRSKVNTWMTGLFKQNVSKQVEKRMTYEISRLYGFDKNEILDFS